jgi:hypothetical protein
MLSSAADKIHSRTDEQPIDRSHREFKTSSNLQEALAGCGKSGADE